MSEATAFERACKVAGGLTALARLLGTQKQTANHWKKQVPAEWCPEIEIATGIRCEELRPDINWGVLRKQACEVKLA